MFTWFLILLTWYIYSSAGGEHSKAPSAYIPIFRPTPRNITVGPGDRAVLRCRVENLGTKTVSLFIISTGQQRKPSTLSLHTSFLPSVVCLLVCFFLPSFLSYHTQTIEMPIMVREKRKYEEPAWTHKGAHNMRSSTTSYYCLYNLQDIGHVDSHILVWFMYT